jgi:hypothetical protein
MLFCRAALPLSCKTLNYVAGIIQRHRASIGSRWRKLNPGYQALLVLACPAERQDVRRARGRVRGRHDHGLEICERDRHPARGQGARSCTRRSGTRRPGTPM